MPTKRKLELFDPNKSDSNDTDFEPDQPSGRKSRKQLSRRGGNSRKRTKRAKYKGSDVSEEDEDEDGLEESFSNSSEDEEAPELNPITGRTVRKATKKAVNYEENSESDVVEAPDVTDLSDLGSPLKKKKRHFQVIKPCEDIDKSNVINGENIEDEDTNQIANRTRTRLVTLKIGVPQRGLRSATTAHITNMRKSTEPDFPSNLRACTRLCMKEDDECITHLPAEDKRDHRLVQNQLPRVTKGTGDIEKPASVTEEELQETSSNNIDAEDTTMATEFVGSDDPEESKIKTESSVLNLDAKSGSNFEEGNSMDTTFDCEDDDVPISRRRKGSEPQFESMQDDISKKSKPSRRLTRGLRSKARNNGAEVGSDFEPPDDASDDEMSKSDTSAKKRGKVHDADSSPGLIGRRNRHTKLKSGSKRQTNSDSADDELDQDEIAEELHDLKEPRRCRPLRREDSEVIYERSGRARNKVDYTIKPLDQLYAADDDAEDAAPTPNKRATGGRNGAYQPWERNLFSTFGPFGGGGGLAPIISGPWGSGAIGVADSDSSDDDLIQRSSGVAENAGMTPTSGSVPGLLPGIGQSNSLDANGGISGVPPNHGKIKTQKELADADPLGVDQSVDFSKIGGLENHINQLKEMVQMPLLYPELFLKFHVTPPRGVLFHGPPGTGKTLLARALAASVGHRGQKITFYMRKGADALSKWVGEAERQLRLLFEEARKTQPSIIFFDEIDGLAPVRSSKQEQIHASIVSTLLALMDGMDGRGQVIVIGATNRPDNIDPALRRPGRFDREFYFGLPDLNARKSILNIHTKNWGLDEQFKTSLAKATKGYGGADLRALCTEAALNSIQRTYPQIYSSNDKLKVDADKIKVTAKDFMLSVQNMIPSSERSTSSGAAPLPKSIEPLLREQLNQIELILDELIPGKKKTTALQEAMYEQYDDEDHGFGREKMLQDFEKSRVFRPRLLIQSEPGMGQSYLGGAILNHFEGLHVQSFDLATLYSDASRSPEAALVQLFAEVKRHKPSVIYLPSVETWYHTLSDAALTTFLGLLRAIPPTDPILVLGITETPPNMISRDLIRDIFGFSKHNRFTVMPPSISSRHSFFSSIGDYVKKCPKDFPEPSNRKKRKLEVLELAPAPATREPTKEEVKLQRKKDHHLLNLLKVAIQPIMEQIQKKYKKFRTPVISQSIIKYIFDEQDPNFVRSDIPVARPYRIDADKDGVVGLRETASGKFFYNLETTTIEERLSNGFYARPKDFLADIRCLAKDAKRIGDKERTLKAQELLTNVEVDIALIEQNPIFADCENLYLRQMRRFKDKMEKKKKRAAENQPSLINESDVVQTSEKNSSLITDASQIHNNNSIITSLTNGNTVNGIPTLSSSFDDMIMEGADNETMFSMQPPIQTHLNDVTSTTISRPLVPSTQMSVLDDAPNILALHDTNKTIPILGYSDRKSLGNWAAQPENGTITQISSSPPIRMTQDLDLPDTQRNKNNGSSQDWTPNQLRGLNNIYPSQSPSASSQISHMTQGKPPFMHMTPPKSTIKSHPSGMANLLNEPYVEHVVSSSQPLVNLQPPPHENPILDLVYIDNALQQFVELSHGCSVEELEQIYRELMNSLWQMRGNWDRNHVMGQLVTVFTDTLHDIKEMKISLVDRVSNTDPIIGSNMS